MLARGLLERMVINQTCVNKNVTLSTPFSMMEAEKRAIGFAPVDELVYFLNKNGCTVLAYADGIIGIVKVRPFRRYFSRGAKKMLV